MIQKSSVFPKLLLNVMEQPTILVKKHIYMTNIDKKFLRVTDLFSIEFGVLIGGEAPKEK